MSQDVSVPIRYIRFQSAADLPLWQHGKSSRKPNDSGWSILRAHFGPPEANAVSDLNLNAGDDITIGGDVVGRDKITNIYVQLNLTPEQQALLARAATMSVELMPGRSAAAADSQVAAALQTALQRVQALPAQAPREVQAAQLELLLKRAILLKTEADQMLLDFARRHAGQIPSPYNTRGEVDLSHLAGDFDEVAYEAKLHEARQLLQQANALDPTHVEVMLHLVQVLDQLTTDHAERERLLFRAESLVKNPRNEHERFQLAQVYFLSALGVEPPNAGQLRQAREIFAQLGRTSWVEHLDLLLQSASGQPQGGPAPTGFQPAGRWHVQIFDLARSVMWLDLYPNGALQGQQQSGFVQMQLAGQWGFNPYTGQLQLQGLGNGFQPFMLALLIQGPHPQQPQTVVAQGGDGFTYWLTRMG